MSAFDRADIEWFLTYLEQGIPTPAIEPLTRLRACLAEIDRLQAQLHAVRTEYLETVVASCIQESGIPPVQIAQAFLTGKEAGDA